MDCMLALTAAQYMGFSEKSPEILPFCPRRIIQRFLIYFLDSCLRGNDTPGLSRRESGELLHSAKLLRDSQMDSNPVYDACAALDCQLGGPFRSLQNCE